MKNILVTGDGGQLSNELKKLAPKFPQYKFTFKSIELDITSLQLLTDFFGQNSFDIVINAAAYTAVDQAEKEVDKANKVNGIAVGYLAEFSLKYNFLLIHISTDFIFDGKSNTFYTENDTPNPLSVYAKSKLMGDKNILEKAVQAVIFRTSWLYSDFGHNFVKTILNLASKNDTIKIISDQIGTPTNAKDLAKVIIFFIKTIEEKQISIESPIIYNYSNEGIASWYDFACSIVEYSQIQCKVLPIKTLEYPLPAKRPAFSILDKSKIKKDLQIEIPHWKDSLKECIFSLMEANK